VPEPRKAALAGNTVGTDRGFLARDMPELEGWLHYRVIDVSSIKELSRRWYPRAYFNAPEKSGGHRALADIRESIAELRYYREAVFVAPPGPDTPTARALGERHVVDHGPPVRNRSRPPPPTRYDRRLCAAVPVAPWWV
jgi:oligoribonuclease